MRLAIRLIRPAEAILTTAVFALILAILATWVPHYLTWPWWLDLDAFAGLAQGWDAGIRPYRDVRAYNFPGRLTSSGPWGSSSAGAGRRVYAADVALLVLLGVAMVTWSRRRLGGVLPGAIGLLAVLGYYAGQSYALVVERDWHGALFAVLSLVALQTARGRAGLALSAASFAVGMTFRPHIVLLLPAIALAIGLDRPEGAPRSPGPRGGAVGGDLRGLGGPGIPPADRAGPRRRPHPRDRRLACALPAEVARLRPSRPSGCSSGAVILTLLLVAAVLARRIAPAPRPAAWPTPGRRRWPWRSSTIRSILTRTPTWTCHSRCCGRSTWRSWRGWSASRSPTPARSGSPPCRGSPSWP